METDVGEVTIVKPNCRNRFSMFYFVHQFSLYLFLRVFVILADITHSSECVNYEVKKSLLTVRKTVRIFCNTFEQYVKACKGYCSRGIVDEFIFSREHLEQIYTRFTVFKENVWQQPSAHMVNLFRFSKTFLTITFEPLVSYKESEFAFFGDSANVCTSQFRGMEANLLFSDRPYCMKQLKKELKTNFTAGLISLCTLQFCKERVMRYLESYKEEAERMNERQRKYIFPMVEKKVAAEKEK